MIVPKIQTLDLAYKLEEDISSIKISELTSKVVEVTLQVVPKLESLINSNCY